MWKLNPKKMTLVPNLLASLFILGTIICNPCQAGEQVSDNDGAVHGAKRPNNIQPEGSSLKNIIHRSSLIVPEDPAVWEIYYDDTSGHPYYHNKRTGATQWENPFGRQNDHGKEDEIDPNELYESWRLYESFEFLGLFDYLTAVNRRSELPRSAPMEQALEEIAKLAGEPIDIAQAKLEVAIFKQEQAIYGDSPIGEREHWEKSAKHMATGGSSSHEELTAQDEKLGEPPSIATPQQRIVLSGAWNDLGNMWYARGEWDMAIECFRKSLFWNPHQTATLLNLSSVLLKLGFENDANQIMLYYDSIDGGTMGGWSHDRENMLRRNIAEGIDSSKQRNEKHRGRTDGELLLQGIRPEDTYADFTSKKHGAVSEVAEVWSSDHSITQKKSGKALEEYAQLQRRMALENNLAESHGICHGPLCSKSKDKIGQQKNPVTQHSEPSPILSDSVASEADTMSMVALTLCIIVVTVLALLPKTNRRKC